MLQKIYIGYEEDWFSIAEPEDTAWAAIEQKGPERYPCMAVRCCDEDRNVMVYSFVYLRDFEYTAPAL